MNEQLTLREAAQELGISTRALRDAIRRGTLSAHRVEIPQGFYYVVDCKEIARYRREHLRRHGRSTGSSKSP